MQTVVGTPHPIFRSRPGKSCNISINARTLALSRRRELYSAHISTGGPSSAPQQTSRPAATSCSTSNLGKSAAPTPSSTASRTISSDESRSTGIGASDLGPPSVRTLQIAPADAAANTTAGTANAEASPAVLEGIDIVGAATTSR